MAKVETTSVPLHYEALRMRSDEKQVINVYGSRVAEDAANEILCEVLTAIRLGPDDDKAGMALSRLVFAHEWVLRIAKLHDYLNSLVRKRRDTVVNRISNSPAHPGRRHESKVFLVHLMRVTMKAERVSAQNAAQIVAQRHGADLGNISAETIKSELQQVSTRVRPAARRPVCWREMASAREVATHLLKFAPSTWKESLMSKGGGRGSI